jgi:arsenite-transporting ATPase
MVMSVDIAHSLSDSFGLENHLLNIHGGMPHRVADNLDIQEVDLQAEIKEHWGDLYGSISTLLRSSGMNNVLAEELAILPGMPEVVCLLYISKYLRENTYDVIILDCAPTGESMRFISLPSTIEWSLQKVYKLKENIPSIAQPLLRIMGVAPIGDLEELEKLRSVYSHLNSIRETLLDTTVTSVRLVCTPEKMVINETLRAYMYFCLYGMNVDMVLVNKIVPDEANNGYFDQLIKDQAGYLQEIKSHFMPARTLQVRNFRREVCGLASLESMGEDIFENLAPNAIFSVEPPYQFEESGGEKLLKIKLPSVNKEHIELFNDREYLVVRVGNFKRHICLPRAFSNMKPSFANFSDGWLSIRFADAG